MEIVTVEKLFKEINVVRKKFKRTTWALFIIT